MRKIVRFRRLAAVPLVLMLVAAACAGSATVTETTSPTAEPAPTTDAGADDVPAVEPTAQPAEPTAVVVEPTTEPAATPAPTPVPTVELPAVEYRTDTILAISRTGQHAYIGTTSPWSTETPCDAAPSEALAVVALDAADQGEITAVGGGVEQSGDIRQLVVGGENSAAILSSCGPADAATLWMQRAEIGNDGRIVRLGEVFPVGGDGEGEPWLLGWIDDDTIEVRVTIEVDPDDYESWLVERRQVSMSSGEIIAAEQFDFFDDNAFGPSPTSITANGFTYRVIEDPNGSVGCEGLGIARTIGLDDGSEQTVALTQPDIRFSTVDSLHVASTGHIAWTTACEGYVSAYVGTLQDDGRIADAHMIDTYAFEVDPDDYVNYQVYRLTDDGFVVGVGQRHNFESGEFSLAVLRWDLSTDPNFVNTADPAPSIDTTPLFDALQANGSWHVGDTLAVNSACGGKTLYGQTPGGYVRAFPAGVEIDAIVDVDLAETHVVDYGDGQFISRTVVVQTECPGEYVGRRVWFGIETEQVVWGLIFEQADLGEVADVRSVRDIVQPGTDFVDYSVAEVELFDGSVVEVELVALPRN